MPGKLDEILAQSRSLADSLRARRPELERAAQRAPARAPFGEALRGRLVGVIAEVKRRSPSAGRIREDLDAATHARQYADAGAAAISVLTNGPFFGGSLADLEAVAATVETPLLRKDFILFEEQLLEARASGASAVLLIARALDQDRLRRLHAEAESIGLEALVEVHDAAELDRALGAGSRIVGVNSRNLDTFEVDVDAAWWLLRDVPTDVIAVAESGMRSVEDVTGAAAAGADAVLVGTALSAAAEPAALLATFRGVPRHAR